MMTNTSQGETRRLARKDVFSTGEAATLCQVSQQTIIRCFDKGKLKGFRVPGSRFRRIPREDLLRFMRENDIASDVLAPASVILLIATIDPRLRDIAQHAVAELGDGRVHVEHVDCPCRAGIYIASERPDLFILDAAMPGANAASICRHLKQHADLRQMRIIILAKPEQAREMVSLLKAGADRVMSKPVDEADLRRDIKAMLNV